MRAGTGAIHSEYNPTSEDLVNFLQIWILPHEQGLAPAYEQRRFSVKTRWNILQKVASRDGRGGALRGLQDLELYATVLENGHFVTHRLTAGRR